MSKTDKKQKLNNKKWYNLDCKKLRTNLQQLGRRLTKFPKFPYLREQFYKLRVSTEVHVGKKRGNSNKIF